MYEIRDDLKPEDVKSPPRGPRGPRCKYPFGSLAIGQHVVVPAGQDLGKTAKAVRASVHRFNKAFPERRFRVLQDVETNEVRVFRAEDRV